MAGRPRKRGLAPPLPPPAERWPATGRSAHDSNCKCARCSGFQVGNTYGFTPGHSKSLVHGACAGLASISPEANAVADSIRSVLPVYHEADEVAVRALSIVLVRIERAERALEARDAGESLPNGKTVEGDTLEKNLRSWLSLCERYLSVLGMTPGSRARLGLDIARARSYTVLDLHQEAVEG